ncbi:NAD(P)H-dependent oxidoreductase [Mycoplasmopsis felis]|uniref:NAD(P)H-dependent oxidoreductase n=1 Tax=Mycoplasmopsis felis TaxID=33923 RepID=UPI0021B06B78|nr:NAD(P)H-dependent oxidoreductase [Mycoplasmopsis felis]UWW00659.1 NAD(P)H-dependent oxidoreductase [Mycoplasmopsis felis]
MKKILFIVGSLRQNSFNKQLSEFVAKELKGKAEVSYLDYSKLPLMNQILKEMTYKLFKKSENKLKKQIYYEYLVLFITKIRQVV